MDLNNVRQTIGLICAVLKHGHCFQLFFTLQSVIIYILCLVMLIRLKASSCKQYFSFTVLESYVIGYDNAKGLANGE